MPGDDHLPFAGAQDEILDEIERFLSNTPARVAGDHVLATVLTVWSEAAPADWDHLRRVFTREVAAYRGVPIELGHARLSASFDGPGRAVRCGSSVTRMAGRAQIGVRVGVHIGEWDPASQGGPLLETTGDIARAAASGEVLVSRTVVDLVPGSGLQFVERGSIRAGDAPREIAVLAVRA